MENVVKFIDKVSNEAEDEVQKLMLWIKKEEPATINALMQAYKITNKFVTIAKSSQVVALEDMISSVIPQAKSWTQDAINLATEMGNAMVSVGGKIPAIDGIALMYCAKLSVLIEGGKTTLEEMIIKVQSMFIKFKSN